MLSTLFDGPTRSDVASFVARDLLPHKVSYDQEHIDAAMRFISGAIAAPSGPVHMFYDLRTGWADAGAGTTAVVIPTMIHYADEGGDPELTERVYALATNLVDAQLPDGSFRPNAGEGSVTTMTSEALLALLAVTQGGYSHPTAEKAAVAAADWLAAAQDDDGRWPHNGGSAAPQGLAVWALSRAATALDRSAYSDAAANHVGWLGNNRRGDGWLGGDDRASVEITDLAKTIDGLIEAGLVMDDETPFDIGVGLLTGIERAYRRAGSGVRLRWRNHLVGAISPAWHGTRRVASIEGSARLALCAYRAARFGAAQPSRTRRFGDEILDAARSAQVVGGIRPELYGSASAVAPIWGRPGALLLSIAATRSLADALLERRDGGLPSERVG